MKRSREFDYTRRQDHLGCFEDFLVDDVFHVAWNFFPENIFSLCAFVEGVVDSKASLKIIRGVIWCF